MKKIMNFLVLFLFVLSIILVSSCEEDEPPPIVSFLVDKTEGLVPCTVVFTNESTNSTSYHWNFGDSTESTQQNVTHEYTSVGDFVVTLTATGEGGSNSANKTITVLPTLTGKWNKTFKLNGKDFPGSMNLIQHEDNKITGDFVFIDGSGHTTLLNTSEISDSNVTIEWMLGGEDKYKLSFQGTVNNNYTLMSGSWYLNGELMDVWSAAKSSKKSTIIKDNDFYNSKINNLLKNLLKTTNQ